jgi:hypothetical protein
LCDAACSSNLELPDHPFALPYPTQTLT